MKAKTDYACSGSEDEMMKGGCLAKGYSQDWAKVSKDRSSGSQDRSDKGVSLRGRL